MAMKEMIEDMVAELTDAKVLVDVDDSLQYLGCTTVNPGSYVIEINVKKHMDLFGQRALDELWDTIRHEVAHVEHARSLHEEISKLAIEYFKENIEGAKKYGFAPVSYERHFQTALIMVGRGTNSTHGPAWKKFARKMGATPKASA